MKTIYKDDYVSRVNLKSLYFTRLTVISYSKAFFKSNVNFTKKILDHPMAQTNKPPIKISTKKLFTKST